MLKAKPLVHQVQVLVDKFQWKVFVYNNMPLYKMATMLLPGQPQFSLLFQKESCLCYKGVTFQDDLLTNKRVVAVWIWLPIGFTVCLRQCSPNRVIILKTLFPYIHPEETLCSWEDVKIQLLTNPCIPGRWTVFRLPLFLHRVFQSWGSQEDQRTF